MSILANNYPQFPLEWNIGEIPTEQACYMLWDKYAMLDNIKEHSKLVANFAFAIANKIQEKGLCNTDFAEAAHRAGLLHDIAKTWTIKNGGSHQQVGASIVRAETKNPLLASCVLHHVVWPWQEGVLGIDNNILHLPFLIMYADKRVKHSSFVTLDERFKDLFERYGTSEDRIKNIQLNYDQAKYIEQQLSNKLEFDLYACTLTSGVLVA